jgi:hypothetical protein
MSTNLKYLQYLQFCTQRYLNSISYCPQYPLQFASWFPNDLNIVQRDTYDLLWNKLRLQADSLGISAQAICSSSFLAILVRYFPQSQENMQKILHSFDIPEVFHMIFFSLLEIFENKSSDLSQLKISHLDSNTKFFQDLEQAKTRLLAYWCEKFGTRKLNSALSESVTVRPLNHIQLTLWQQFSSGYSIKSISDAMGLKPLAVLNGIIYTLESYCVGYLHPVLLHWKRFDIPIEIETRLYTIISQSHNNLKYIGLFRKELKDDIPYEDIRLVLLKYNVENGLQHMWRVNEGHFQTEDELDFQNPDDKERTVPYTPELNESEVLYAISQHDGLSITCLTKFFNSKWENIEPYTSRLISEKVVWKKGGLFCAS